MEKISRREKEKLVRENDILTTAERLFYDKGFTNVSMDEIALKAEFTKKTVYKYFSTKDDLLIAVLSKGFKKLSNYMKSASGEGKNGFEKIKNISLAYYKFYKENPETFNLMTQIGHIKDKNNTKYSEFINFDNAMFDGLKKLFAEGKKDGSIRSDIDEKMAAYVSAFSSTAFFHLFSITGKTFSEHFKLDAEKFILFSLELSADAIRSRAE